MPNGMKSLALLTFVMVAGASAPAHAQSKWLGSAIAYGGNAQNRVLCTLNNLGTGPVALSSIRVFNNAGAAQILALNSCGATLAAKQTCTFGSDTVSQRIYGCKVFVDKRALMRGVIQFFDVSGELLTSQPME